MHDSSSNRTGSTNSAVASLLATNLHRAVIPTHAASMSSASAFFHRNHKIIDMRVFPNVKVLVMDGVVPDRTRT